MSAGDTIEEMSVMQENHLEHSYFCREMFSHFDGLNAPIEAKDEAIKDFLSVSDGIIVIGNVYTINMKKDLLFAKEINMEVEYIEDAEQY